MKISNPVASRGGDPCRAASATPTGSEQVSHAFASIPPERLGLNGEFDYHGLAKRVVHAFKQRFGEASLNHWAIAQRGGIVTIRGQIKSVYLLYQFIDLALRTEGAVGVDVNGSTIFSHIDLNQAWPLSPGLSGHSYR